jgi:hypothetical protein
MGIEPPTITKTRKPRSDMARTPAYGEVRPTDGSWHVQFVPSREAQFLAYVCYRTELICPRCYNDHSLLGTVQVIEYRAYTVGRDGHLNACEPLICASDEEAIEKANRLVHGHDVELWSGARLVIVLKHDATQTKAAPPG